ncbi:MAG: hypothetical protein MPJ05_07640 [Nitrosopumilus sp.]|nr:hypothetical protein [Nitrosopumilus sp.]
MRITELPEVRQGSAKRWYKLIQAWRHRGAAQPPTPSKPLCITGRFKDGGIPDEVEIERLEQWENWISSQ